jgi:hypothetical protein
MRAIIAHVTVNGMTGDPNVLVDEFFGAVSFDAGEPTRYERLHDLFVPGGLIVKAVGDAYEATDVSGFIEPRQAMVDSGRLTEFREFETGFTADRFGYAAQRTSRYGKQGVLDGGAFSGRGVIFTQFARTPQGWRITAMTWDDERPGLDFPADGA